MSQANEELEAIRLGAHPPPTDNGDAMTRWRTLQSTGSRS